MIFGSSTLPFSDPEVTNPILKSAVFTRLDFNITIFLGPRVGLVVTVQGRLCSQLHLQSLCNYLIFIFFSVCLFQVVKVVGSNISHKLRLSRVKLSDEGTYECRVIDFSDDAGARHHRVRAYLQVVAESDVDSNHNDNFEVLDDTKRGVGIIDGDDGDSHGGTKEHGHHQNHGHHQEHSKRPSSPAHHGHSHGSSSQQPKAGRELRKRDVDSNQNHNDCTNEPSCAL